MDVVQGFMLKIWLVVLPETPQLPRALFILQCFILGQLFAQLFGNLVDLQLQRFIISYTLFLWSQGEIADT